MNIYWYISKLPFVSRSLSGTEQSRLVKDLQDVIKRLKMDFEIKSFADLEDSESPVIFAFEGNAARNVSGQVFWLAMKERDTGLLLAGSARFAIGAPQRESLINPSADPVGAVRAAFEDDNELRERDHLSFAWKELMKDSREGSLPRASGLAIFARTMKLGDSSEGDIQKIVVGTPIYVEQVSVGGKIAGLGRMSGLLPNKPS